MGRKRRGETTREQACRIRAGKLPEGLEKSQPGHQDTNPWWLHAPHQCCAQGTQGTNTTMPRYTENGLKGLTSARPCQQLPKSHSFSQHPVQPTQLFFFFFLASASLLLPMLEWLVMLLRLEILSEEFCRLMRSSGVSKRSRRDQERRCQQTASASTPKPPALSSLHRFPSPAQTPSELSEPPHKVTWG